MKRLDRDAVIHSCHILEGEDITGSIISSTQQLPVQARPGSSECKRYRDACMCQSVTTIGGRRGACSKQRYRLQGGVHKAQGRCTAVKAPTLLRPDRGHHFRPLQLPAAARHCRRSFAGRPVPEPWRGNTMMCTFPTESPGAVNTQCQLTVACARCLSRSWNCKRMTPLSSTECGKPIMHFRYVSALQIFSFIVTYYPIL
jgi:hypothetical protein